MKHQEVNRGLKMKLREYVSLIIVSGLVFGFLISFVPRYLIFVAPFLYDPHVVKFTLTVPNALGFFEDWLFWSVLITGLGSALYMFWNFRKKYELLE